MHLTDYSRLIISFSMSADLGIEAVGESIPTTFYNQNATYE